VAVGVQSYRDGRVPQHLAHDLWMNVLCQKEVGAGVPEVVEPYVGKRGPPQEWLPVPVVEVAGVGGVDPGVGEHEPALRPGAVRCGPLLTASEEGVGSATVWTGTMHLTLE
jgi:hypothetical protein